MFSNYLNKQRETLRQLVSQLRKYFEYVSILGVDTKSVQVSFQKGTPTLRDGQDTDNGFAIKMSNGKAFYEYSLDLIPDDLDSLVDKIINDLELGKDYEKDMVKTLKVDDAPLRKDFEREDDFADYSNEDLIKFVSRIGEIAAKAGDNVLNAAVDISTMDVSKIFVSENRELTQHYTWVNGFLMLVMRGEQKMVFPREVLYSNKIKDIIDNLESRIEPCYKKGEKLLTATPIEPGIYDVITDPTITGLIAHEAFGHGLEMDQFVKDRAVSVHYMKDYVASSITSMRDGAAATHSVASYFFDDDGVLAQDTQLIKDGILQGGMCDLTSSRELGVNPTGNGRRESHTHKAYTRMTNTFIESGKDKLEDMIKSIKHGYMLFETNNGMEDPKNWQIQCVAEYGIEIVDGKLTDHYVSPVVMSGNVIDLLKSISMVSDDFEVIGAGMCGKGYKEWVRVSDGGPALKVRVKLS